MTAGQNNDGADAVPVRRKLAAILHADVAGYSRLMGADESGTHARLVECRAVFEGGIREHGGRVVGTAGDAVLADFPSVVEALEAAVRIQEDMAVRNADWPADLAFRFRIGINIGDVIIDGGDIFGDGVNVAARVESLAQPGGIAISGAAYDQVRNKTDLSFRALGAHRAKNIADPIPIYAVDHHASRATGLGPKQRRLPRSVLLPSLAAAVVGIGVLAWLMAESSWLASDGASEGAGTDDSALAEDAGIPTIAVLPFENLGGDAEQGYFSIGVTEDVIASLGRFSNLLVLSWNAVAPYASGDIALQQLSRDLGARYLVSGSIRRSGDHLRVTVQLTDARPGLVLWDDRYERTLDDVFAVQDDIVRNIVGALAVRVTELERERAFEQPTEDLHAYDLVLRGRESLRQVSRMSNITARQLFERAIVLDPDYADAYAGLSLTHARDASFGWIEWPGQAIELSRTYAEQAVTLDGQSAIGHAVLANAMYFQQDVEQAIPQIGHALRLNPNDPQILRMHGDLLMMYGRPQDAVRSLEKAMRLDPRPFGQFFTVLGMSYYLLERYEDALATIDRYGHRASESPMEFIVLAVAYSQLGNAEAASDAANRVRRTSPFFNAELFVTSFRRQEDRDHILEGLRMAGLE